MTTGTGPRSRTDSGTFAANARRLEALLEEYGAWLKQSVRRLCPRDMGISPEDVEQEVRVRLWKSIESGRNIEHPPSYLYSIASTVTIDAMRSVRSRRRHLASPEASDDNGDGEGPLERRPASEPSPESQTRRREMLAAARRLLDELPESRRRAVGLYLQGFKIQEIADLMGWTEPKARNLLYRGLSTLREHLAAEGLDHGDI
ncbi:MAG: sigma-70 family RNA polymerase sigma factor [Acidobacteriota bacterium]